MMITRAGANFDDPRSRPQTGMGLETVNADNRSPCQEQKAKFMKNNSFFKFSHKKPRPFLPGCMQGLPMNARRGTAACR
jgi:hypothetical protein